MNAIPFIKNITDANNTLVLTNDELDCIIKGLRMSVVSGALDLYTERKIEDILELIKINNK